MSPQTLKKFFDPNSMMPPILFMVFDYVGVVLAEHAAFFLRDRLDYWANAHYYYADAYVYGWVPALFLILLSNSRSYEQMKPIVEIMRGIFMSVFYGWTVSIILIYFLKAGNEASRLFIILFGLFVLFGVCIIRYAVLKFMKKFNLFSEPVIIIGAGLTAEHVIRFWKNDLGYRYEILGFVDDHPVSDILPKDYPILGGFSDAKKIIKGTKVKTVIIAAPGITKEQLQDLINEIQPHVKNISFIPDLIGTPMAGVDAAILFSEKILVLNVRNNLASPYNKFAKRIFDLFCTLTGGILISPFLLIIAVAVAINNKGNVIL